MNSRISLRPDEEMQRIIKRNQRTNESKEACLERLLGEADFIFEQLHVAGLHIKDVNDFKQNEEKSRRILAKGSYQ